MLGNMTINEDAEQSEHVLTAVIVDGMLSSNIYQAHVHVEIRGDALHMRGSHTVHLRPELRQSGGRWNGDAWVMRYDDGVEFMKTHPDVCFTIKNLDVARSVYE